MSKKNIAYVRVSTTAQLEGNGPGQQLADIMAWAKMTGTEIDEVVEEDETGTIEEREQIMLLKARAARGEIRKIIVSQSSRLGRKMWVAEKLWEDFEALDVEMISATEKFDNSPMGIAMRQMASVFAQLNKADMLMRMRTCRRVAVARKGTYMGGNEPYGYSAAGRGQLDVVKPEAVLVARTFELAGLGLTMAGVARLLDEEGFRTRKGTRIAPMQVWRLLQREAVYRGQDTINDVQREPGVKPAQPAVLK
jgi:site-specific DNA recombinase